MAGPEGGAPAGVSSGMLESMKQANASNQDGIHSGASAGDPDSIGVGGQITTIGSDGIDFGIGGNLDNGLAKFTGALNAKPTDIGASMEPFGINGVGFVQGKDIQGVGNIQLQNTSIEKGVNAPEGIGIPGIGGQGQGQQH